MSVRVRAIWAADPVMSYGHLRTLSLRLVSIRGRQTSRPARPHSMLLMDDSFPKRTSIHTKVYFLIAIFYLFHI